MGSYCPLKGTQWYKTLTSCVFIVQNLIVPTATKSTLQSKSQSDGQHGHISSRHECDIISHFPSIYSSFTPISLSNIFLPPWSSLWCSSLIDSTDRFCTLHQYHLNQINQMHPKLLYLLWMIYKAIIKYESQYWFTVKLRTIWVN